MTLWNVTHYFRLKSSDYRLFQVCFSEADNSNWGLDNTNYKNPNDYCNLNVEALILDISQKQCEYIIDAIFSLMFTSFLLQILF